MAVLLNYAERDFLAVLGRVATFASILFGFPLAMLGLKDALFSLLAVPNSRHALLGLSAHQVYTLVLLAVVSAIAIAVSDIGIVVGVSGALLGAAIVYIFPALIYGAAAGSERRRPSRELYADRDGGAVAVHRLVYLLVPFGAYLGVLGVFMTLKGA